MKSKGQGTISSPTPEDDVIDTAKKEHQKKQRRQKLVIMVLAVFVVALLVLIAVFIGMLVSSTEEPDRLEGLTEIEVRTISHVAVLYSIRST